MGAKAGYDYNPQSGFTPTESTQTYQALDLANHKRDLDAVGLTDPKNPGYQDYADMSSLAASAGLGDKGALDNLKHYLSPDEDEEPTNPIALQAFQTSPAYKQLQDKIAKENVADINAKSRVDVVTQRGVNNTNAAPAKASAANTKAQALAFQQTQQMLDQARGQKANQQAESDFYAGQKADKLANRTDLNNMSPQMARLFAAEVGKMATGGTPTIYELQGLDADAFPSQFASVIQKFTNEPSSKNAGAFLKQYQDYAHDLSDTAKEQILDRYGRIINVNENRIGPENTQLLKEQYLNRFTNQAKKQNGGLMKSSGGSGAIQHSPGDIVNVRGQNYTVGPDGDSLTPVQ
jgi:hypothetical protein